MTNEINSIQYLRALAVVLVVWAHASEQLVWISTYLPGTYGAVGVDIFFVISGFIMVYTRANRNITPLVFFTRRIKRIVPLYWFYVLLLFFVALLLPQAVRSVNPDLTHLFASLFFIPVSSPAFPGSYWPLLIPGWTLNYEMAFYALFAVALFFKDAYRIPIIGTVMLFFVFLGPYSNIEVIESFYSNSIILEFLAGVVLGKIYLQGLIKKNLQLGMLLIILSVVLFLSAKFLVFGDRFLGQGIASFLLVLGALHFQSREGFWQGIFHTIGNASYSIYLSHIFTLGLLRYVWISFLDIQLQGFFGAITFMFVAVGLSIFVGWLSYEIIEKNINLKLRHKKH